MENQPSILAKFAAGKALTSIAAHVSKAMDTFASWSLAAFGAGLGLWIGNLASLSAYISPATFVDAGSIFLWMFVICICQRYIASIVGGAAATAADTLKNNENIAVIDFEVYFAELLKGYPSLLRGPLKRAVAAVNAGDLAYSGRMLVRLAMMQTLLVLIYTFLSVRCLSVILGGVHN